MLDEPSNQALSGAKGAACTTEGTPWGLPPSVFCEAANQPETRLLTAGGGLTAGEVALYGNYRPMLDIKAPLCCIAAYDRWTTMIRSALLPEGRHHLSRARDRNTNSLPRELMTWPVRERRS